MLFTRSISALSESPENKLRKPFSRFAARSCINAASNSCTTEAIRLVNK